MPLGFDEVTICNMALSRTGAKSTIETLEEDNTPANLCKLWYDAARLATLEVYDWSFARKGQILAQHPVEAPQLRWSFRYKVPSDLVMQRYIENPAGPDADSVPFDTENAGDGTMSIVTKMEKASLMYTFDQNDTTLFSLHFVLMMSTRLAVFINFELTGKLGVGDRLLRDFDEMALQAPNTDATTSVPVKERDAISIRSRL